MMSLLMIGIGASYYFVSVYVQKKLTLMSQATLPSVDMLNRIREQVWEVWTVREDEMETGLRFREMEKQAIAFQNTSGQEERAQVAVVLRSALLKLQEATDKDDYERFMADAKSINQIVAGAIENETGLLMRKNQEVNRIITITNWLSLAVIAVAVLFCMIPGWWLASSISKALGKTQRAAEQIASGDLSQSLPEEGQDEISELAVAFNRMVDTIRQADEEITREVEDRIRAERKAQSAAKAKSDFLAHMSHEFRTPLNGILGYSQMLSMDPGLSEKNLEVVKSLRKSGESLLELINDVLDLTKIEAQKMNIQKSRFYLGDFLESLVESYAEQIKTKGLQFKINLDPQLPEDILSDQIRLRQILVNLLGNAVKFTDRGEVGIAVSPLEGGIRFAVFDTGIGIAQEHHAAVMQPFQQIERRDRQNQGTGLGLPISNRLLEMLGTHLNIKSALGEGTTFWFDLPQPDVKYRKLVHVPTRVTGYRGKARKILIGEEKLSTASTMMPLLQKVGFEVLHLRTPAIFLDKCQFFQPDVVLIDLYFAEADGVEVMRELQTRYDRNPDMQMPVVFIFSDHRQPNDRERSLGAGANMFLGMPIRFTDLLEGLRSELDLVWVEGDGAENGKAQAPLTPEPPQAEQLPEAPALRDLVELARSGNIRQMKVRLGEIKAGVPETARFVDRILILCSEYRINAILQELEALVKPEATENV